MALPLVKRMHAANATDDLRVIALTGMIGSDSDETPLEKARELDIQYAVGLTAMFGEWTPYLNLNKMPSLTYAFVIGRSGGVVWRGDTSRDTDEFIEAVRAALAAPKLRPLPASADAELAEAVAAYALGDLLKARKLAEKTAASFGKKKGEAAQAIVAEATQLIGQVDDTLLELSGALDQAFEARDAEACARAALTLRSLFPKSDAAASVRSRLAEDSSFAATFESWTTWIELGNERPPAFPERHEKLEKRYAKSLEKYLKVQSDGPGAAQAREWLELFEAGDG